MKIYFRDGLLIVSCETQAERDILAQFTKGLPTPLEVKGVIYEHGIKLDKRTNENPLHELER